MATSELIIVEGNLLNFAGDYMIAHQCNCTTTTGKGLSKDIFDKFPDADVYRHRRLFGSVDRPGDLSIFYIYNYL